MALKWYVVHTYSGYENKVKMSLQERIELAGAQELFSDILIPEEDVVELISGEKKTSKRKFFPGYILVRMEMSDETWHIVKNTPKVTGFIGSKDKPSPIPDNDVENLKVRIDGPFTNFDGVIDEIKPEKSKLRVIVSIFGRPTPVELDFIQVTQG